MLNDRRFLFFNMCNLLELKNIGHMSMVNWTNTFMHSFPLLCSIHCQLKIASLCRPRFILFQFSHSVASDSLPPHGLQHTRLPCPSLTLRSLLKFLSIELVMPSSHLVLCHPLLFLSPIFLSYQGLFLEKAMSPHSSTLAWKIPWTEEPGRLQSMGSLRVRHD